MISIESGRQRKRRISRKLIITILVMIMLISSICADYVILNKFIKIDKSIKELRNWQNEVEKNGINLE